MKGGALLGFLLIVLGGLLMVTAWRNRIGALLKELSA